MAYNPTELAVGAAVLAVAGSFLAYALTAVGGTSSRGGYELTASFRSVEGVNVGTDIRLAGVKVGSVAAITLDCRLLLMSGGGLGRSGGRYHSVPLKLPRRHDSGPEPERAAAR